MTGGSDIDSDRTGLEVSRRAVLIGGVAVAGSIVLEGCVTPAWKTSSGGPNPESTISFWLRRAEDQLELRYTFWNAEFASLIHRPMSIEPRDKSIPLTVRIEFGAQHVLEQAFYEDAGNTEPPVSPPVGSELSGVSRLAFDIFPESLAHGRLQLTWEKLLDWSAWQPRLVPEIVPDASIRAPGELETALELPTRLLLSPDPKHRWASAIAPLEATGRTELWHARLLGEGEARPKVRAIWTPDFLPDSRELCFRASLDGEDRRRIVRATHAAEFKPEPVEPKLLLLTSRGGWLDLDKSWAVIPEHLSLLTSWKHRANQGRDNFVQVEYPSVLYPSGFYVSVVKTTERRYQRSPDGARTAYLRQRITIKFVEPRRSYSSWDMPFTELIPEELETPPLDVPSDFFDGADFRDGAFWPQIAAVPYEFPFRGIDHEGAEQKFTAPQICILALTEPRASQLRAAASREYSSAGNSPLRHRSFAAQSVAVSPTSVSGRTSVNVDVIEFEGKPGSRPEVPFRGFEPLARRLKASLSAASASKALPPSTPAWFVPYDLDAPSNANQVFLLAEPGASRLSIGFEGQTSNSGAFLSPSFTVAGVGRINGPFGGDASLPFAAGPDPFASGRFDPAQFFPREAKVIGGVSISDVLDVAIGAAGLRVPTMLSELIDTTESLPVLSHSLTWQTDELKSSPAFGALDPVFLVSKDAGSSVPEPGAATVLALRAEAVVPLFDPTAGYATVDASIANFCVQMAVSGNGIRLRVRSVSFGASADGKTKFNLDIQDYELVGPVLSFVKTLQEYFSTFSEDSPIDVTPYGVTLNLPSLDLPPIILGAFNIESVKIRSGVYVPFSGAPLEFHFNLSSKQDPFAVTVGVLGGLGHFQMVLDTEGVKLIDASFGFGAYKALEIGGVLKGAAFIMGGLSYTSKRVPGTDPNGPSFNNIVDYSAFVHAGGSGTVLGFLSVGIDYHVGLYIQQGVGTSRMWGVVEVSYSYKVGFFSKSVSVRFEKTFQGSKSKGLRSEFSATALAASSPMTLDQYRQYRSAFARAA